MVLVLVYVLSPVPLVVLLFDTLFDLVLVDLVDPLLSSLHGLSGLLFPFPDTGGLLELIHTDQWHIEPGLLVLTLTSKLPEKR